MKYKYIIFEEPDGMELPVVFPEIVQHDRMAILLNDLGKPVAAGFVSVDNDNFSCFGKSISLELGARPQDNEIFNKLGNLTI